MTGHLSFPPSHRLTSKAAFDRVFADGRRSADRYFTVLSVGNELPHARLGLAVSRKVASRAVVRNRIRRLVRESFRLHQDALADDLVVMARPAAREASAAQLRDSLDDHWSRVGSGR